MVSIAEASTGGEFHPDRFVSQTSPPQSRRILPLSIAAGIDFAMRPANTPAGLAAARALLLEDVSLVSHFLSGNGIRAGTDFSIANPDPGFKVRSFGVTKDIVNRDVQQGLLTARIECRCDVDIWPPGQVSPEGIIGAIDWSIVPQPLEILPLRPVVAMGGTTRLQMRGLPASRRLGPPNGPFAVSLRVLSDVPPDQRGTISSGVAGGEVGSRIVRVTGPSTDVEYVAPAAGVRGTRVEFISIHFAARDGKAGPFLGSVAVCVTGDNG